MISAIGDGAEQVNAKRQDESDGSSILSRISIIAAQIMLPLVVILAWQLKGRSTSYWRLVLGTPSGVLETIRQWITTSGFWTDVGTTMTEAGLGYLIGIAGSIVLISTVRSSRFASTLAKPYIAAGNALPKIVLGPVFIIWFGIGVQSKIYFVAASSGFIVFYGIYTALASIDLSIVLNVRALGSRTRDLIRYVYIPQVVTGIVSSLRVSASWSILSAVIAELLLSDKGLGYRIGVAQTALNADGVASGIIVVSLLGYTVDRLLLRLEMGLTSWRHS
jgi:NitT/TauT family transport system permease protein